MKRSGPHYGGAQTAFWHVRSAIAEGSEAEESGGRMGDSHP